MSGAAGIGKTSLACHAADASCQRGERCQYFAFEESQAQLLRNMRSIGLDLEPWVKKGLLRFQSARPTMSGLEMHLASIHRQVESFQPHLVIVDPITNFISAGTAAEASSMMMRLVDYLKASEITALLTNLNHTEVALEQAELEISSLIDTWLFLRDIELNGDLLQPGRPAHYSSRVAWPIATRYGNSFSPTGAFNSPRPTWGRKVF